MRRLISGLIGIVLLGLAYPAPAKADGLERFERELRPLLAPLELSYGKATALGPSGFSLSDVSGVLKDTDKPDEKPVPFTAKRVVVDDLDFDHVSKDDGPHFLKLRVEGASAGGLAGEWLAQYGLSSATLDFTIDYRLDVERKVFTLNKLEVALPGLARLELGLILDGVTPAWIADTDAAMDQVSLRTATVTYDDTSLMATLLPKLAAEEGKTAEDYVAGGLALLGLFAQGQEPRTMAVFDALASFAGDYQRPKGPLRVTVSPDKNLSAKDWDQLSTGTSVVDVLGLSVTYPGTRPGAAKAALGSAAAALLATPARPAPKADFDCTAGRRFFVLSGGGWWPATVREPTQSSQRCVVRLEGTDEEEDVVVDADEVMPWSIEGPGQAAKRCSKGDRVWIKSEGGWYPATVRQTPKPGGRCTVRLEDDDDAEDETVELRRVRVIAR
jgi:hypothetical protein